jgi:hypothetical protein
VKRANTFDREWELIAGKTVHSDTRELQAHTLPPSLTTFSASSSSYPGNDSRSETGGKEAPEEKKRKKRKRKRKERKRRKDHLCDFLRVLATAPPCFCNLTLEDKLIPVKKKRKKAETTVFFVNFSKQTRSKFQ